MPLQSSMGTCAIGTAAAANADRPAPPTKAVRTAHFFFFVIGNSTVHPASHPRGGGEQGQDSGGKRVMWQQCDELQTSATKWQNRVSSRQERPAFNI
jgi:ribosomal protein L2